MLKKILDLGWSGCKRLVWAETKNRNICQCWHKDIPGKESTYPTASSVSLSWVAFRLLHGEDYFWLDYKGNSYQVSHLCGDSRCFDPYHVVIEGQGINIRRNWCINRSRLGDSEHACPHGAMFRSSGHPCLVM
jgi:hypothetical protein